MTNSVVVRHYVPTEPMPKIGACYTYGPKEGKPWAEVTPLRVHTEGDGWRLDEYELRFVGRVSPELKVHIRSTFDRASGGMWRQMMEDEMLKL
jgi:hypothetical protein